MDGGREDRLARGPRTSVTLTDGTELKVGDRCRAKIGSRWRAAVVTEIMQGSGVDRAFVRLAARSGAEPKPLSRYSLRQSLTRQA